MRPGDQFRSVRALVVMLCCLLAAAGEAVAQDAPGLPVELLLAAALQESTHAPQPFNATLHLAHDGVARTMALHVDGPKVRVQYGATAQVERQDLGRLWLFDVKKQTFLDLPLGRDTLASPALLRQECTITPQGEEMVDGRRSLKYHVRMPNRFYEPELLRPADEARQVEMTVWHSPELGVLLRREGPGNATMTLADIIPGPQSMELFQVPDGYRRASLPANFAK